MAVSITGSGLGKTTSSAVGTSVWVFVETSVAGGETGTMGVWGVELSVVVMGVSCPCFQMY